MKNKIIDIKSIDNNCMLICDKSTMFTNVENEKFVSE